MINEKYQRVIDLSSLPTLDLPDPRPRHIVEKRPRWSISRRGDYHARLVTQEVLEAGWDRVRRNRGSHGSDGVSVDAFGRVQDAEINNLLMDLSRDAYRPGPLRPVPIPKKDGGTRWLRIPCVRDRVVQAAAHILLSEGLEPEFEHWSFGYRPGKSVEQAVALAEAWMTAGFDHVIDADLARFFDTVPHQEMITKLLIATDDAELAWTVSLWLGATDGIDANVPNIGIPQGAPISPILANLYLDDLDEAFSGARLRMVRFADDFLIFLRGASDAQAALRDLTVFLKGQKLDLHPEKTRIVPPGEVMDFLGKVIVRSALQPDREPLAVLRDLPPAMDAVADDDSGGRAQSLYLYSPGRRLDRAHQSFVVREPDGAEAARVHATLTQRIEIGPRCEISGDALRLAAESEIPVALVNGAGQAEAHLVGVHDRWGDRHLAQAKACLDPPQATEIARALILAQVMSRKELLYDIHHRQKVGEAKTAAGQLQGQIKALRLAINVKEVLNAESNAARIYWPYFGAGLLHGFSLPVRARQTAENPVAVLLDLAAHLLLRDTEAAVLRAGLHPGFGIMHVSRRRGMALVWDLAEPFRAPLAEATVREALNTQTIRIGDFQETDGKWRLLPTGVTAFIRTYERAAHRKGPDPVTGLDLTWRDRMRRQAERLVRTVELGEPLVVAVKH